MHVPSCALCFSQISICQVTQWTPIVRMKRSRNASLKTSVSLSLSWCAWTDRDHPRLPNRGATPAEAQAEAGQVWRHLGDQGSHATREIAADESHLRGKGLQGDSNRGIRGVRGDGVMEGVMVH